MQRATLISGGSCNFKAPFLGRLLGVYAAAINVPRLYRVRSLIYGISEAANDSLSPPLPSSKVFHCSRERTIPSASRFIVSPQSCLSTSATVSIARFASSSSLLPREPIYILSRMIVDTGFRNRFRVRGNRERERLDFHRVEYNFSFKF